MFVILTMLANALVSYEHQGYPYYSPAWAVVSTGDETVLIDGVRYVRDQ